MGQIQEIRYSPTRSTNGQITGVMGVVTDITERSQAEQALVDKNVALREVLDRIEEQKREMGRTILTNIDKIIMPLIHVLEQGLPADQRKYMSLLKQSLEDIASPFISRLSSKLAGLTPTEIRICDLIRRGLSNKEIAQLEHIAPATVNKHRAHIRRKLGIANKKVNLSAHLESFMQVQQEAPL
jgi:DNA-binding CsgD family transcriptional regulator